MSTISPKLGSNLFENFPNWDILLPPPPLETIKTAVKEAIPIRDDAKKIEKIAQKFGIEYQLLDQYLAPIRDVLAGKERPTKKKCVDSNTLNEALQEYLVESKPLEVKSNHEEIIKGVVDVVIWKRPMTKTSKQFDLEYEPFRQLVMQTKQKLVSQKPLKGKDLISLAAKNCREVAEKLNWNIISLVKLGGLGRPPKRKYSESDTE